MERHSRAERLSPSELAAEAGVDSAYVEALVRAGALQLKGMPEPVALARVLYD